MYSSSVPVGRKTSTHLKRFREGRSLLRTSQATYPHLDRIEALLVDLEARSGNLAKQSVRNYRSTYLTMAKVLLDVEGLSPAEMELALGVAERRINDKLVLYAGKKRTVMLKGGVGKAGGAAAALESPSQKANKLNIRTVRRIVAELKRRAESHRHFASAWAVFYIVSAARIGWRPCELQGAAIVGDTLWIKTAKLTNGQRYTRPFPLEKIPDNSILAARVIVENLPAMGWLEFERWRNVAAEAVAQACIQLGIDRVSLYAFRHIAIQTWRAAGVSTADIASLAGHFNLRTAGRHYGGRAGADWLEDSPLAGRKLAPAAAVGAPVEASRPQAVAFDTDDFPAPRAMPNTSSGGAALWATYAAKLDDHPTPNLPASTTVRPKPRQKPG